MAVKPTAQSTVSVPIKLFVAILFLSNLLVYQLASVFSWQTFMTQDRPAFGDTQSDESQAHQSPGLYNAAGSAYRGPLTIPQGVAVALPSVLVEEDTIERGQYGGQGDKQHLGGFTDLDTHGLSPAAWKHIVNYLGVKSILDVGCGKGVSTSWFHLHGMDTYCVEGSHDAHQKSLLPEAGLDPSHLVEHDFSRGPWWPSKTVDMVWCVELLEHVGRNFHHNLMPAFKSAAIVLVTHSTWGGWHHVEIHKKEWWIAKFQTHGFVYSPDLTDQFRKIAAQTMNDKTPIEGTTYVAQHIRINSLVFINPEVASRPEHAHLLAEPGCHLSREATRQCGEDMKKGSIETPLPPEFRPLEITPEMDEEWERLVFGKTIAEAEAAGSAPGSEAQGA